MTLGSTALPEWLGITVTEELQGPSSCSISLSAIDPNSMGLVDRYIDAVGSEVTIAIDDVVMFVGDVAGMSLNLQGGGSSSVTLTGYDRRYRMSRGTKPRPPFLDHTLADVVRAIATEGDYGLSVVIEGGLMTDQKRKSITKPVGISDLDFLHSEIHLIGYEVIVFGRELHLRPSQHHKGATLALDARTDLRSFSSTLPGGAQPHSVTVQWCSGTSKDAGEATAAIDQIKPMKSSAPKPRLGADRLAALGERRDVIDDAPVESAEHAEALALARLESLSLGLVTASASCAGRQDLHIGAVVELKNLGPRFSGNYLVSSATHELGRQGYSTSLGLRRNAL